MTTVDFSHVYEGLKDFQLATVEHVIDRFYGADPTERFLVADEVGLGKTLVARGVIARSIEHHVEQDTDRIDVVYICSNRDIARQNVGRLNVLERNDFNLATRITLLPRVLRDLESNRINFVSFTPGTSFDLKSSEGRVEERLLLYHMLRHLWGAGTVRRYKRDMKVFAGGAQYENFFRYVDQRPEAGAFDELLAEEFDAELRQAEQQAHEDGRPPLQERFVDLRDRLAPVRRTRDVPRNVRADRTALIGQLREMLARTCVEALEPDLVILDEFQRFKHLFGADNPAGELAEKLFEYPDVRVLLLSATPYKMYTLADEQDENHYEDFLNTLRFLMDDEEEIEEFTDHLRRYRRGLFALDDGGINQVRNAKAEIEASLTGVMARTERLAVTEDRNGMLSEPEVHGLRLTTDDVRQYVAAEEVSDRLDAGGMLRYWKSTSYPLTFMRGYQLDRHLEDEVDRGQAWWLPDAIQRPGLSLNFDQIDTYDEVDPANPRLRSLIRDVVDSGGWQLLWIPPSLPYYRLGESFADPALGGFTKRLIFSAWKVVPRVIAALVSYAAERRMLTAGGESVENSPEFRRDRGQLLQLTRSEARLTGMPVFALLYPSPTLAELGDPRSLAARLGGYSEPITQEAALDEVRRRIERRFADELSQAPDAGQVDERWYWAAPLLLDQTRDDAGTRGWFADPAETARLMQAAGIHEEAELDDDGSELGADAGWVAHVEEAAAFVRGEAQPLGRVPHDLLDVVAEMALAAPGVSALRALDRLNPSTRGVDDPATRHHAAGIAWTFRQLFNRVDATFLLRSDASGEHPEDAYWRLVLRYCLDGCLQAVLDEYIHVLREWRGLTGVSGTALLEPVTETVREALGLRTSNYGVRRIRDDDGAVDLQTERMRGTFAVPFGQERDFRDEGARASSVRTAFNSPFRPFVLATTSVGQEGLDFHNYCHAVMHWNLPANPVDLEQREGRVHRYKGHAVRKNVAADHRARGLGEDPDPWTAMFDAAAESRDPDDSALVPYWVYSPRDSAASIERYVPTLPLSRDSRRLTRLRQSLAAYRLVFGQPRQEDLVAFLRDRVDEDRLKELLEDLQIDLSPEPVTDERRAALEAASPFEVKARSDLSVL